MPDANSRHRTLRLSNQPPRNHIAFIVGSFPTMPTAALPDLMLVNSSRLYKYTPAPGMTAFRELSGLGDFAPCAKWERWNEN